MSPELVQVLTLLLAASGPIAIIARKFMEQRQAKQTAELAQTQKEEDARLQREQVAAAAREESERLWQEQGQKRVKDLEESASRAVQQFKDMADTQRLTHLALDTLQVRANEQERKIFQLESTNQKQAAQITDLTTQIEVLTRRLSDLTADNTLKDGIIAKLTEQLQTITSERDELVRAKAQSDADLITERLERTRLQAELDTLRKVGTGPLADRPSTGSDASKSDPVVPQSPAAPTSGTTTSGSASPVIANDKPEGT